MKLFLSAPATVANLGSGFDTFALAINMRNEVEIEEAKEFSVVENGIQVEGEDLFLTSFKMMMEKSGLGLNYKIIKHTSIPPQKGLGSSAASIVLGIAAAMKIIRRFSKQRLFEITSELEGHPDNAAACVYGGFTVSGYFDGKYKTISLPPLFSKLTIVIPPFCTSTHEARKILPKNIPIEDAVFNIQRVAMIVANSNGKITQEFFEDKIHQRARLSLHPELMSFFEETKRKIKAPIFLCGSGTAIAIAGVQTLQVPKGWSLVHESTSTKGITFRYF